MRRRITFMCLLCLLCVLVSACGPRSDPPTPAPLPVSAPPVSAPPAGMSSHTLTVGGQERTFLLYRPDGLPATPVPLVVMLHGALGTAEQAAASYGWNAEADRGRFLVAYPNGLNRSWAVSPDCCGPPAKNGIDDVAFITAVVSAVGTTSPVDPARVFATGISNGGLLAYRLACDTTTFAAIAPVSATMLQPCPSPHPVSIIHIHGTADGTIPYGGGPGKRESKADGNIPVHIDGPPVPVLIDKWRTIDHCGQPAITTAAPVTTSVASCADGRRVELITIEGAGHQWPGSAGPGPVASRLLNLDPPSTALAATPTIWTFFTTWGA